MLEEKKDGLVIKPNLLLELSNNLKIIDKAKFKTIDEMLNLAKITRKLKEQIQDITDLKTQLVELVNETRQRYSKLYQEQTKEVKEYSEKEKIDLELVNEMKKELQDNGTENLMKECNEKMNLDFEFDINQEDKNTLKQVITDNFQKLNMDIENLSEVIEKLS